MGKLDGKVVIITGCSSGLGKQQAIRLAEEGAKLAICSRTESRLMETKKLCEESGAEVFAMALDIMSYDDLVTFVDKTVERFGTIDVLVNNAHTVTNPGPFLEKPIEDLDTEMHSSVYAYWHLMKLCYPYLKDKPGAGSSIINFASEAAVAGLESFAPYAASKEAVRGLSRVVAREWGQFNIRVNTLCPNGLTDNCQMGFDHLEPDVREWAENAFTDNPFKRAGDPYHDVAPIVVFFASDDSRWITGQNIHADGGTLINA
ncbi:NAD(P)-dependent dehydrogenase (short-subunit alcohol dehydrogenase family) [Sinobaca qinghaiensis]|uniref:NAD(P)-dependent dehydrogenase (Short-subunit alcohol dehydrogenase family) n=1 Tax=Sinobaca qinghaiensis TaxID=342944 RepID=A0A419V080_9BACL|nr:SDR family oxidoreductase [Sinobaca qinghaiensis]RKD71345.1 NAD(P)-dependent dehydrogenase (short-subunit alcohol dehydrogenase family) [Sinobaca qinghaiensis]